MSMLYSCGPAMAEHKLNTMIGRRMFGPTEHNICSATILSMFENFYDATFLPIMYYSTTGLPGLILYKLVDLLDSMFGNYRSENLAIARYIAKLDDLLSVGPVALAQRLLSKIYGPEMLSASPKLWLVSAFAKRLGVHLDAPGYYSSKLRTLASINCEGQDADATHVARAKLLLSCYSFALTAAVTFGFIPRFIISS